MAFFFDWNIINEPGARFEISVALHLLKWVCYQQDVFGRNLDPLYYRDKADREVDFIIIENNKPILMIEAKFSDANIARGLIYLKNKYPQVRAIQVHLTGKKEYQTPSGIEVFNVIPLLNELV